jgi:F0F1-type ATP synthase assembly protein I
MMTDGLGWVAGRFLGCSPLFLFVLFYCFLLLPDCLLIFFSLLLGILLGFLLGLVPIPRDTLVLRFTWHRARKIQDSQQNENRNAFHPESLITSPGQVCLKSFRCALVSPKAI